MSQNEMQDHVVSAISALFDNDEVLLRINASERAIAHRLAIYLENEFANWDVDCEYNRDGHDHKKLVSKLNALKDNSGGDSDEQSVFPDIIVHHRTGLQSKHNLLVIEIKKSTNSLSRELDFAKLRTFTTDFGRRRRMNYHYQFGLFIELRAWRRTPKVGRLIAKGIWYCNGEPLSKRPVRLHTKDFDYRN